MAFFVLLGVYVGCLPIFGVQSVKTSGLVFCPLMKKWVPGSDSSFQPKKDQPLADVCAPKKLKAEFLDESVRTFRFSQILFDSQQIENSFFSYAEKGKCAFAEIGRLANLPERQFLQVAAVEESLVNRQNDFGKSAVEKFVPSRLARPPTTVPQPLFETSAVRKLSRVSRRIQPRAPPAFYA